MDQENNELQNDEQYQLSKKQKFVDNVKKARNGIDSYKAAGGLRGIASNAIDNKKNEIKDKAKEKINDKKDELKNKINDKIPDSVKKKQQEAKAKQEALKNKLNAPKEKIDAIKNKFNNPELNEKTFRKGVRSAVDAVAPGSGFAAEKALDTPLGEDAIDAARSASNPVSAVTKGAKKLAATIVKREVKKKVVLFTAPSIGIIATILIIVLAVGSGSSDIQTFYKGSTSGKVGLSGLEEDFEEEYNYYESFYQNILNYSNTYGVDDALVVSVLASYSDRSEYTELEKNNKDYMEEKILEVVEAASSSVSVEKGDYSDRESGSDFFWWLYDDFVEEYFSSYFSSSMTKEEKFEQKKEIIDSIYLYYEDIKEYSLAGGLESYYYVDCKGVSIQGGKTLPLDDYVTGVILAETASAAADMSQGDNTALLNDLKAHAIAIRTYTLSSTNNCSKTIANNTSAQVYKDPSNFKNQYYYKYVEQAVKDTKGKVLLNKSGKIFSSQYDSFYKGNDFRCSGASCSVTYKKVPGTETHKVSVPNEPIYTKYMNGGHGNGLSQVASIYLAKQGKNYEEILKDAYESGISIGSSEVIEDGGGLSVADASGFRQRTSQPDRNNKFFYSNLNPLYNTKYQGQCTWYSIGRANEVLNTANSSLKWNIAGNAGTWYALNKERGTSGFKSSTNVNKPKVGAIIVWKGVSKVNPWGHVAVIEQVNSDGTVNYSEGNNSSYINPSSNPYGFHYAQNISTSKISKPSSSLQFVGYIYLVE